MNHTATISECESRWNEAIKMPKSTAVDLLDIESASAVFKKLDLTIHSQFFDRSAFGSWFVVGISEKRRIRVCRDGHDGLISIEKIPGGPAGNWTVLWSTLDPAEQTPAKLEFQLRSLL